MIGSVVSHLAQPHTLQTVFEIGREHENLVNASTHNDVAAFRVASEIQLPFTLGQVEFFYRNFLPILIPE